MSPADRRAVLILTAAFGLGIVAVAIGVVAFGGLVVEQEPITARHEVVLVRRAQIPPGFRDLEIVAIRPDGSERHLAFLLDQALPSTLVTWTLDARIDQHGWLAVGFAPYGPSRVPVTESTGMLVDLGNLAGQPRKLTGRTEVALLGDGRLAMRQGERPGSIVDPDTGGDGGPTPDQPIIWTTLNNGFCHRCGTDPEEQPFLSQLPVGDGLIWELTTDPFAGSGRLALLDRGGDVVSTATIDSDLLGDLVGQSPDRTLLALQQWSDIEQTSTVVVPLDGGRATSHRGAFAGFLPIVQAPSGA